MIGWIAWGFFAGLTALALFIWLKKSPQYRNKAQPETLMEARLLFLPKIVLVESLLLLAFLLTDVNKLILIWMYPIVWWIMQIVFLKKPTQLDINK